MGAPSHGPLQTSVLSMRKKAPRYVIDIFGEDGRAPDVGTIFREIAPNAKKGFKGFVRILSVRPVKVKKSRGETARYALTIERLAELPEGETVAMTVRSYSKPKAPKGMDKQPGDRFDPLLPP